MPPERTDNPKPYYVHTDPQGNTHIVIYVGDFLMYLCGRMIDPQTMIKTGYTHDIDCELCPSLLEQLRSRRHDG